MKTKVQAAWRRIWHWIKTPPELSNKSSAWLTAALLLFAAVGLCFLCLLIGTLDLSRGRFSSYLHEPTILLLNLLPCLILVAFLYFITNRAWISYALSSFLLLLINFVNYFKVVLRGDPFVAADIFDAGEGAGIMGQYEFSFPWVFYVSLALLLLGSLVLLRYARYRVKKKRWYVRVLALCACIAVCAGAWSVYTDDGLYDRQTNHSLFNAWKEAENYASHGTLYSLLHSVDDLFEGEPDGYSEEQAAEILSAYSDKDIDTKVNVVVTMLESFSDLSLFEQINFTADPYAPYHELLSECYYGTLITDTIGGGTINAERAFLTGFTYPQPKYSVTTNSFVHYFAAQGYQTDGSHPGHDWFYSRNSINARLGFDRYLFMEGHYEALTDEEYAPDAVLFEELARIYDEETADGEPYFSFSVSYQNHSPYNDESLVGSEFVSHEGLSDGAYYMVNNYLNGISDTCRQVAAYVDTFRDNEEPVVLLFFGDHKPTLGSGNCYYEEMGIDAQELSAEGCENLYSTPYFIWANEAAKEALNLDLSREGRTISPAFLMAELFDLCSWEGPAWMQYQRLVRETIPVLHRGKLYMENGVLTGTLSPTAQAVYDEFAVVQYYERTTLHRSKK